MTHTVQVKAFSRTWDESNDNKMTCYYYNGSFQADEMTIRDALGLTLGMIEIQDKATLRDWVRMMDCFHDALFIVTDTNKTVSFDAYADDNC